MQFSLRDHSPNCPLAHTQSQGSFPYPQQSRFWSLFHFCLVGFHLPDLLREFFIIGMDL
jgi:hypothetical protein